MTDMNESYAETIMRVSITAPYLDRHCHEAVYEVDLVMLKTGKSRLGSHGNKLQAGDGKKA